MPVIVGYGVLTIDRRGAKGTENTGLRGPLRGDGPMGHEDSDRPRSRQSSSGAVEHFLGTGR